MSALRLLRCYLGLGSNLGNREGYLVGALRGLAGDPRLYVRRVSCLYATAPVGGVEQPPFLNAVAEVGVYLTPRELLALCQHVERQASRERTIPWGPRTLDLDLLLCEGAICADPELTLPHPRLLERQFVLAPLAEIAPDLRLPDGRTAAQAADPSDRGVCRLGPLRWRY